MLRGFIKLVARTEILFTGEELQEDKADICELIEVAAKARLADGLPQEVHFLGPRA